MENYLRELKDLLRMGEYHEVCDQLFDNLKVNTSKQNEIVHIQGQIREHNKKFAMGNIDYSECSLQCSRLALRLVEIVSLLNINFFKPEFVNQLKGSHTEDLTEKFEELLVVDETGNDQQNTYL